MTTIERVKAWLNPEPKNPARRLIIGGPAVRDVTALVESGYGTTAPEVITNLARDEVERRGL